MTNPGMVRGLDQGTTQTIAYGALLNKIEDIEMHSLSKLNTSYSPNLAVVIRDPTSEQYLIKHLHVDPQTNPNKFIYEDHSVDKSDLMPFPKEELESVVRHLHLYQQIQVGVAEYTGKDNISLNELIGLVALKYNDMGLSRTASLEIASC